MKECTFSTNAPLDACVTKYFIAEGSKR